MCFLKSYYPCNKILEHSQSLNTNLQQNLCLAQINLQEKHIPRDEKHKLWVNNQGIEHKFNLLYSKVVANQKLITSLQNKINDTFKILEEMDIQDEKIQEISQENSDAVKIENFPKILQTCSKISQQEALKQKLFPSKEYHYRIELSGQLPAQILKERNFAFDVNLCSLSGAIIKNIFLGVCDNEGNWISSCSSGMDFMKGNCEIQIHHGVGEFRKIYPREVSRAFRDQHVNFVVYPQPSVIKYVDSINRWEEYVDPLEVEPLILEKVYIRAKKVQK